MGHGAVGVEGNAVVITSGNGRVAGVVGGVGSHGVGGVFGGETAGV